MRVAHTILTLVVRIFAVLLLAQSLAHTMMLSSVATR
jgi:hypothetical protein